MIRISKPKKIRLTVCFMVWDLMELLVQIKIPLKLLAKLQIIMYKDILCMTPKKRVPKQFRICVLGQNQFIQHI